MHAPSSYYWANKTSRSVEEYVEVEQLKKKKKNDIKWFIFFFLKSVALLLQA